MNPPPYWDADRDDSLVCCAVRAETQDVRTFVFAAPEPRRFAYRAGQFMTIGVAIDGVAVNRCYTLSSTPTRPDTLSITVKRVPGGPVSNWLHDHLRPGMALESTGPMGDFVLPGTNAGPLLFLSAGSGITPLMSMARAASDAAQDPDIIFFHSARTPEDIICRSELNYFNALSRGIRTVTVCGSPGEKDWNGPNGRLTIDLLRQACPDFLERTTFVCGPAAYMTSVRAMLEGARYDMSRYHQESFDFEQFGTEQPDLAAEIVAEEPHADTHGGGFRVTFTKSGLTIDCDSTTTILTAARGAGMRLPSSCRQGVCGTCKSRLVSGAVDMKAAGGIRQREVDQGMILLCCSRPTNDLVVER
jgi:ferredoxin-NADP reductase